MYRCILISQFSYTHTLLESEHIRHTLIQPFDGDPKQRSSTIAQVHSVEHLRDVVHHPIVVTTLFEYVPPILTPEREKQAHEFRATLHEAIEKKFIEARTIYHR